MAVSSWRRSHIEETTSAGLGIHDGHFAGILKNIHHCSTLGKIKLKNYECFLQSGCLDQFWMSLKRHGECIGQSANTVSALTLLPPLSQGVQEAAGRQVCRG